MRIWSVAPVAAAAFAAIGASSGPSLAEQGHRLSGPHVYENLAVYFVHGASAPGAVPLTLQEAVAKGKVQVIETGRVNELQIENSGTEPVFVQAGDIVKGGKQDRVLTVSFLLPAKSGRLPIASFCVEQGRWTGRGKEDVNKFSSASEAMPSRSALLAMAAPAPAKDGFRPAGELPAGGEVAVKQKQVWDSVAATQNKLAGGLNSSVASPSSATSLQLSLENAALQGARAGYLAALKAKGEAEPDILGYVVAINGEMSSANLYPSNAMFRKMWDKQLTAVVTEAIGEKRGPAPVSAAPAAAKATEFLVEAERGQALERGGAAGSRQETRDGAKTLYNEARGDGGWLHRSYLAK
jgi:hypothetical protein